MSTDHPSRQVVYNLPQDLLFLPFKLRYRLPDEAALRRLLDALRDWIEHPWTHAEWRAFSRQPPMQREGALSPIPDAWPDKARPVRAIRWQIDEALRDLDAGHMEEVDAIHDRAIEAFKTLQQRRQQYPPSPRGPRKGPKDDDAFFEQVVSAVQAFQKKGFTPTQKRIATYLKDTLDELGDILRRKPSDRGAHSMTLRLAYRDKEAAHALGLSVRSILYLRRTGKLGHARIGRRADAAWRARAADRASLREGTARLNADEPMPPKHSNAASGGEPEEACERGVLSARRRIGDVNEYSTPPDTLRALLKLSRQLLDDLAASVGYWRWLNSLPVRSLKPRLQLRQRKRRSPHAVRSGRSVVAVDAQCGQVIVTSSFWEESLHATSLKTKLA
jgi:hypothetical protein